MKDWSPSQIKFALEECGYSYSDLDRMYGLAFNTTCKASRYPHPAGEVAISSIIGLHPADIWPSRYDEKSVRLYPQPQYEQITKKKQVQNRGAA